LQTIVGGKDCDDIFFLCDQALQTRQTNALSPNIDYA